MAIKIQKQQTETTEETALTPVNNALAAFSAANLFQVEAPKETGNLLPQVKIPYPIEVKPGKAFGMADVYCAGLFDGQKFQQIKAPYVVTVIAGREASRKLKVVTTADGKQEKEYDRAYKSMGAGYDKSAAVFEQHAADPAAEKGLSFIVGIIDADGRVSVAELPAFKVLKDYWNRALHQARIANGLGLRVKVQNHGDNVTVSKNDPTKAYLDPKKFTQHEIVELDQGQLASLAAVLDASKDKFEAWCRQ